jgi:NAD+ kinase
MKLDKICIIYKKSLFELHKNAYKNINVNSIKKNILLSHLENEKTKKTVCDVLNSLNINYKMISRGSLRKMYFINNYDLVLSLGGDGTFFETARHIKNIPIMMINSDRYFSSAFFSIANRLDFKEKFTKYLEDGLRKIKLSRIKLKINKKIVDEMILNDILFTHKIPSLCVRYILKIDKKSENQKSSGLWISTAAGSSGAMYSAGGKKMQIESDRLQFKIREPLVDYALKNSIVDKIEIISANSDGMLYIDGFLAKYNVRIGDKIEIEKSRWPVYLIK